MLNFLLWLISLQVKLVGKLIKLNDKANRKKESAPALQFTNIPGLQLTNASGVLRIKYFCWCVSDDYKLIGNPAVLIHSDPQAAAMDYYINYLPEDIRTKYRISGDNLTCLSRPIGTEPDSTSDFPNK